MSLGNNTSYDVRHRAVRAVLEEKLPVAVVAQAYGTNRSTVHRWLTRFREGGDIGPALSACTLYSRWLNTLATET